MNSSSVRSNGSVRSRRTVMPQPYPPPRRARLFDARKLDSSRRRVTNHRIPQPPDSPRRVCEEVSARRCGPCAGRLARARGQRGSGIGKFNDKGFNQDQLAGLNRAVARLGVKKIALQSYSSSDYLPNLTTAVREGANIVSAAGYLLAPTLAQVASQFPNVDFTITDDSVRGPDFKNAKSIKNIEGLVYASNQAGCLVGYLAGEMVKAAGGKQVIGAVGGIKIPAVDDYIVGYNYCAHLADRRIKVLVGYSQDFVAQDKCKAITQNQIGQGSKVEFQVAGGCGLGTLNA